MICLEPPLAESYRCRDASYRLTAKALETPFVKECLLTHRIVTCFKKATLQGLVYEQIGARSSIAEE